MELSYTWLGVIFSVEKGIAWHNLEEKAGSIPRGRGWELSLF